VCELKYTDDGDGGCCLIACQRFSDEEQNYEKIVFYSFAIFFVL
jgi:hypothetical protein